MRELSRSADRLAAQLFDAPDERDEFLQGLRSGDRGKKALVWLDNSFERWSRQTPDTTPCERPLWMPPWVSLAQDTLEERGWYGEGRVYRMDLSSVFMGAVCVGGVADKSAIITDMCAAPGGKSIFLWRGISPKLLVSNEVMGKRLSALISNLKRCRVAPSIVTTLDVKAFREKFPCSASLVVVDAPCSGQSLYAKGEVPQGAFHPATVNANVNRQRRIMAEASHVVSRGGYLAYMTCTFSREENEGIVEWFLKKYPQYLPCVVQSHEPFRSAYSDAPCYRLFPQQRLGAGGFCALFRREDGEVLNEGAFYGARVAWECGNRE